MKTATWRQLRHDFGSVLASVGQGEPVEISKRGRIIAHVPIPWTDTFRESEVLAATHTEKLGVRSIHLRHVGLALALKASEFLTYDTRQAALAKAAGPKVKP